MMRKRSKNLSKINKSKIVVLTMASLKLPNQKEATERITFNQSPNNKKMWKESRRVKSNKNKMLLLQIRLRRNKNRRKRKTPMVKSEL